ncbi:MAG TPA: ABC transporter substrate-binding protein [Thermoleophilaceae bacterium]|nr:ABC transporter substrate-binding protein [Thermoleophilaceae bacterium]
MSRAAHTGPAWSATALVALALALGACGDQPEGGGQPEPGSKPQPQADPANARFDLTIGDLVPRSGDLAPFAPAAIKSADLAVERANAALKREDVKGVEVAVRHADTKTDGRAARTAARKLLGRGATCLTGAWASASTIPVAQGVASAQQVPLISPASTSSQITTLEDQGYVFRTAPSNNLQGEALADVVEEELGGSDEEIVVAGRNDAYGQGIAQTFRRAWEAKGGRLTSSPVLYDPKQPDLKEEAERIVSGDPAAFVIVDFPDTYATISKQLLDTGRFRASRLFVPDGLAGEGLTDTVPERALRGARGTRPGTREEGEDAEAFDRLFTRSDERPRERQTFDAQNFDATMLCFLAAVAAGSSEGTAIQSRLRDVSGPPGRPVSYRDLDEAVRLLRRGEDIDYRGASGPIDFDAQGDPTVGTYEVFRYGRGGRFTIERQVEAKAGQGVVDDAGDLSQPQGDETSR